MSSRRVLVAGAGVAGLTCAHLLAARGWHVDCAPGPQTTGPVVVIGRPTADLLLQLWHADEALFSGAHRLHGRAIHWEQVTSPAHSASPAFAMPVDIVRKRLVERAAAAGMRFVALAQLDPTTYDWVVQAGGREAASEGSIAFGRRRGVAASVKLTPHARTDRTVMESVPGGWLFLIPQGLGRGALQAVFAGEIVESCADLRKLLTQSRVTSTLVEEIVNEPTVFASMPRLAMTPCMSRSIAVGEAALTLDPMSGNGVGSGLRTAILAAAVLDAVGREAIPEACLDHYTQRLRDAMRGHVRTCVGFYGRAEHAAAWHVEIDAMTKALHRLPSAPDVPSFVLNHGYLERAAQGECV